MVFVFTVVGMGFHGRLRSSRRGVALLITVFVTAVVATIAVATTQSTILQTRTTSTRIDLTQAWRQASDKIVEIESVLAAAPDEFLRRVLPSERARVCQQGPDASTVFQPGTSWPADCGSLWVYQDATSTSPDVLEITPPTTDDPALQVKILSRFGTVDAGFEVRYILDGTGRWVWGSSSELSLDDPYPSSEVDFSGAVYSAGSSSVPPSGGVTVTDGAVAVEGEMLWQPSDPSNAYYSSNPNPASSPAISNIRDVAPTRITPGQLSAAVTQFERVACPGFDTSGDVPTARNFQLASGTQRLAHLCITSGAELQDVNSVLRTVPEDTSAAMAFVTDPNASIAGDEYISVYTSSTAPDLSSSSMLACGSDASGCSLTAVQGSLNASNDPGRLQYWENSSIGSAFLGDFKLPASGVVGAHADFFAGYCSSVTNLLDEHEYQSGQACVNLSGLDAGQTVTTALTFVAGTLEDPKDLVVNAPVYVEANGNVAMVATENVYVPYWTHPSNDVLRADVHLLGVGRSSQLIPSVSSFPAADLYPPSSVGSEWSRELAVTGSVTGRDLDAGIAGFDKVIYRPNPVDAAQTPSWFGGADAEWNKVSITRITSQDECGVDTRICDGWGTDPNLTSDIDIAPPPPPLDVPPSAPLNLVATIVDTASRLVKVELDPPLFEGSSPVTEYTVVSSPGSQTCIISQLPLECFIFGLPSGFFTFSATASSNSGTSIQSLPSNEIGFEPAPPANFTVEAADVQDLGVVELNWEPNAGADFKLTVVRTSDQRIYYQQSAVPGSSVIVSGLSSGDFKFTLEACNASGCSDPSEKTYAFAPPAAHQALEASNPVVWWRGNDNILEAPSSPTIADWSGNGFDGTHIGTPEYAGAIQSAQVPGYAVDDVSNPYDSNRWRTNLYRDLDKLSVAGAAVPTRGMTMGGWFFTTAATEGTFLSVEGANGQTVAFGQGDGTSFDSAGNMLTLRTSNVCWMNTGYEIPSNEWVHIAVTVELSADIHAYVNGTRVYTQTDCDPELSSPTGDPAIGGNTAETDVSALYVQDTVFYNRALTGGELANILNAAINNDVTTTPSQPAQPAWSRSRAYPSGANEMITDSSDPFVTYYHNGLYTGWAASDTLWRHTLPSTSCGTPQTYTAAGGSFNSPTGILSSDLVLDLCSSGPGTAAQLSGEYDVEVLSHSPWGFWKFDEVTGSSASDSSGNGNIGSYVGTASNPSNSLANSTGASRDFSAGNAVSLPAWVYAPQENEFTMEAWVKNSGKAAWQPIVVDRFGPPTYGGLYFGLFEGRPHINVSFDTSSSNMVQATSYTALPENEWAHVAISYDGSGSSSGLKTFVNGVETEGQTFTDSITPIGSNEVVQSASALYEDLVLDLNPWGFWKFDDPAQMGLDSSGNARNAASVGTVDSVADSGPLTGTSAEVTSTGLADGLPLTDQFDVTANASTITCWVYIDGTEKGACASVGSDGTGWSLGVGGTNYQNDGQSVVGLYPDKRWIPTGTAGSLEQGWNHLAMQVSADTGLARFFVNGEFVFDSPGVAPIAPTAGALLGNQSDGGSGLRSADYPFDDVAVFDYLVPDADIAKLAQARDRSVVPGVADGSLQVTVASVDVAGNITAHPASQPVLVPDGNDVDDTTDPPPNAPDLKTITVSGSDLTVIYDRAAGAVDYALTTSSSIGAPLPGTPWIGGGPEGGDNTGYLDNVAIYETELSSADIRANYMASGRLELTAFEAKTVELGPTLAYTFDEYEGPVAKPFLGANESPSQNAIYQGPSNQFGNMPSHSDARFSSVTFGGSNTHWLEIPNTVNATQRTTAASVAMWVKAPLSSDSTTSDNVAVYGSGNFNEAEDQHSVYVSNSSGLIQHVVRTDDGQRTSCQTPNGSIVANQWHFITVTFGGGTMKTYIDGVESASCSKSGTLASNNDHVTVGNFYTSTSTPYGWDPVSVDDFSSYDRALSATEATALYASYS